MAAPISLRDALVAMAELEPGDDAARDAILDLLGLGGGPAAVVVPAPAAGALTIPSGVPAAPPSGLGPPAVAPPAETPLPPLALPATLKRTRSTARTRPAWLPAGSGPLLAAAREAGAAPAPPPIFAPIRTRAIYTAALSTWVPEGDLDVDRAVSERARGRPLRAIPSLPLRTLRRGVQLLLDRGPGMAPFAGDVRLLEDELAMLLSGAQIERLYFSRCPTRQVREGLRSPRRRWRPPPRGVPVLVASDFAMVGQAHDAEAASVGEWLQFAREVRAEGHAIVGLVPFAAARWPAALAETITFIHWSEHTIAAVVHRALREAQGGAR